MAAWIHRAAGRADGVRCRRRWDRRRPMPWPRSSRGCVPADNVIRADHPACPTPPASCSCGCPKLGRDSPVRQTSACKSRRRPPLVARSEQRFNTGDLVILSLQLHHLVSGHSQDPPKITRKAISRRASASRFCPACCECHAAAQSTRITSWRPSLEVPCRLPRFVGDSGSKGALSRLSPYFDFVADQALLKHGRVLRLPVCRRPTQRVAGPPGRLPGVRAVMEGRRSRGWSARALRLPIMHPPRSWPCRP